MTGALGRSDDLTIEAIWRCRCVAPTKRLGEPEDRAPPSRHGFSCSVHRKTDPGPGHPLPLFLAGARCMLASAHDGAVDHQPFKIGFTRQRQQHRVENARLNPAIITPLYRAIVAEPFRQIAPTPARARHPQKRIQKLPVVGGGPRLPWVPPGTNPLIRSHWSSRSASQPIADPKISLMMWTPPHRAAVVMLPAGQPRGRGAFAMTIMTIGFDLALSSPQLHRNENALPEVALLTRHGAHRRSSDNRAESPCRNPQSLSQIGPPNTVRMVQ